MNAPPEVEVAVIGAGAAGLGAAAELQRRGIGGVAVLERADAVGSSWRSRYEGLQPEHRAGALRRSRRPIPAGAGTLAVQRGVRRISRGPPEPRGARRALRGRGGRSIAARPALDPADSSVRSQARFVVVATGYDRVPRMPDWPGRDTFTRELIHASDSATQARIEPGTC